ncbi:MAG: sigma-70 family RNA polymerase sigma factor [Planctomycetota bacterium]
MAPALPSLPTPEASFADYARTGSVGAFARAFDATCQPLLLVAARLARGRDRAEDLLQQTWIVALRRRADFDPSRPLLAWLIGILSREVLRAQRTGRRQRAREDQVGAAWEAGAVERQDRESVAESAARKEFAADATQALQQLDDVHRQVLILRLNHGLSSVEIGRALGRSPETVRSQLARGLDKLRRLLPAGHLVPAAVAFDLAEPARLAVVRARVLAQVGALAPAATTSLTVFGIVIVPKLLLPAAVLLAALTTFLLLRQPDDPARPALATADTTPVAAARAETPSATTGSASLAIDARPDAARTALPETAAISPPVATYGTIEVRGRCVDEQGVAVPGCFLHATSDGSTLAQARGDRAGRFALVVPTSSGEMLLHVRCRGRGNRVAPAPTAAPPVGGTVDLGDILVPVAAGVRVRITDRLGQPLSIGDGTIEASSPRLFEDALRGTPEPQRVRVRNQDSVDLPQLTLGRWRLALHARGFACEPLELDVVRTGADAQLVAVPVANLVGIVRDARQRPLGGIRVTATLGDVVDPDRQRIFAAAPEILLPHAPHTRTGDDGRFELQVAGAARGDAGVLVVLRDPGNRFAPRCLQTRLDAGEQTVEMMPAHSLVVRVVEAESERPVDAADVALTDASGLPLVPGQEARTKRGAARFDGLDGAAVHVRVRPPGESGLQMALIAATPRPRGDAPESNLPDVVVRLQPTPLVHVLVRCGERPCANSLVQIVDASTRDVSVSDEPRDPLVDTHALREAPRLLGEATTDDRGAAVVALVGDAPRKVVRITSPAHAPHLVSAPGSRGTEADPWIVQVRLGGTVRVHVNDRPSHGAVALALVRSRGGRGFHPLGLDQPTIDAGGNAVFTHVPAGAWDVVVARFSTSVAHYELDATPAVLRFGEVRVDDGDDVALEIDGKPIQQSELDAPVTWLDGALGDDPELTLSVRTARGWSLVGRLRVESGRVRRQDLFPGTYRLVGPRDAGRAEFELAPATTFRQELVLQPR